MSDIPANVELSFTGSHVVDIFISYAHIDNGSGWITDFHSALQGRLRELLGTDQIVVWRDVRLDRIGSYKDDLRRCIANSAYFLSVLTPRYLNSESCRQELDWFTAAAKKATGLGEDVKPRLVRVVKTDIENEEQPEEFGESLGYLFYEPDLQNPHRFREFGSRDGMPRYDRFRDLLDDLAQDLRWKLRGLRRILSVRTAPLRTIFLARTTTDLERQRASIQSELIGRGYSVLPRESLPEVGPELTAAVGELLAKSDVVVHLFGPRYGVIPELETKSIGEVLYDAALPQLERPGFHQLVWIAPRVEGLEPAQRDFLARVQGTAHQVGAGTVDVLETTFESFKEGLLDVVAREPEPAPNPFKKRAKSIYLVCDQIDLRQEQLEKIKAYLRGRGHPVEMPPFQGEPDELRAMEEELIGDTDAALIYYGTTRDLWVLRKRKSVLKVLSSKQKGQGYARGLYLAAPKDDVKAVSYLEGRDRIYPEAEGFPPLLLLGDCGEFLPEKLENFISVLDS